VHSLNADSRRSGSHRIEQRGAVGEARRAALGVNDTGGLLLRSGAEHSVQRRGGIAPLEFLLHLLQRAGQTLRAENSVVCRSHAFS
jgi:hypothetical protein